MAIQWHPLLAQFLRDVLSDRIQIRDSVPLGEMPIEMDLLFQPRGQIASLPYPYNYLGQRTIGEFKGPGDTANWDSVAQIEGYACLYQRQQNIEDRGEITLWVIASQYTQSFSRYIEDLTSIGKGVFRGTLAQFPICQIDLGTLPITVATFPLLLVYKGDVAREKAIVQFFIDHHEELRESSLFIELLHPEALKEVLRTMDIESLRGFDLDLPAILRLFDTQRIIQTIGLKEAIQTVGLEEVIQTVGLEDLAKTISSALSDEDKERFIERMRQSDRDGEKREKREKREEK